jgi:signal transduction histidine kinase
LAQDIDGKMTEGRARNRARGTGSSGANARLSKAQASAEATLATGKKHLQEIRHIRPSLRVNAVLIVLAMLVLPQLIVVGWSLMERDIGGKLQWETKTSTEEVAAILASPEYLTDSAIATEARMNDVASRWATRIRVVRDDGVVVFDVDSDRGTDLVHQVGTLFFGPDGAPTLRELDETLGPVNKRQEVVKVTGWSVPEPAPPPPLLPEGTSHHYPFGKNRDTDSSPVSTAFRGSAPPPSDGSVETGCRVSPAGKLLLCHAARAATIGGRSHVIYAQESSRRAVRALYDLRYHLARLSIVMLPLALIFSWWMGRRMVRPIEWLRERVLEKAKSANPRADIDLRGGDEVRDLAEAFNDLLGALDTKRRANEAFVADLVHEFKNPVAAIRACGESLEKGGVDEKRAARLSKILADSSGRLDALVSQFLELARAEAGMPREARADVDMGALANGMVSAIESSFPEVKIVAEVSADADAIVHGVSSRLDSLLRNLVDNAASFAGDGGSVTVRVNRKNDTVILEVADTGPGIEAEDLPHVFDRFFTKRVMKPVHSTSSDRSRGSGLGLALVKAVAEAHDGEVSAQSTPGEGATFRVVLPASGTTTRSSAIHSESHSVSSEGANEST